MIEADRLVSADSSGFEEAADRAIRPKLLAEYVGQPQVRSQMEIFIQAAKAARRRPRSPADFWPARVGENHPGQYRRQ